MHKQKNSILHNFIPPKIVSKPDPMTGDYNPFPTFPYAGSLRPVYPLSPRRTIPDSIPHPDYAEDGVPKMGRMINRHKVEQLDKTAQDAMRKVCRLAREVLDIAAAALRPGITTDELDKIVHEECIKREVSAAGHMDGENRRKQDQADSLPVLPITAELQHVPQVRVHLRQRGHLPRHPRPICT